MYFRFATIAALLSAPLLALAQSNPNPFNIPPAGWQVTAGEPIELDWNPTTDGTISLILRSGAGSNLNDGVTIASNLENDGSYTWTPASNLPRRSDYTIEIVSDSDPNATNYSPPFIVESTNVIQSTTITSASASSSTGTSTGTQSTESSSSNSGDTTSTGTGSSTGTRTRTRLIPDPFTGSSSSGGSGPTGTGGGASFQPTQASSSSEGSAARATAIGMLGAVALGALAL